MSQSLQKKKRTFFVPLFYLKKDFFYHLCFISMYSILNTISKYTYFYVLRITSYTFLLAFKLGKSLQSILNIKMSNLQKIDVYNFQYKINAWDVMNLFFPSHKCINKCINQSINKQIKQHQRSILYLLDFTRT